MLLVSHKMFVFENEAALLCVTMRERARVFAARIQCKTFLYNFCYFKIQFLWCTFQAHFGVGLRHFQKVVLRMKLFSLCNLSLSYRQNRGGKICFHSCHYQNQNFSLVSHSCRSCTTLVALAPLMSHSCCTCVTCVALISQSCRSSLALLL